MTVALVLGAGGVAGGAFHSGVLAALQKSMGWDPRTADVIVGTSAGSLAGATLRAGFGAHDMLARAEGRTLSAQGDLIMRKVGPYRGPPPFRLAARRRSGQEVAAALARAVARPFAAPPWALFTGLLPEGQVSTSMIFDAIAGLHDEPWPARPLWICAVRQSDGRRTVFGRDHRSAHVAEAVAASCAIPGFFSPVDIEGTAYVDGGVHSPTNTDVLLDKAAGALPTLVVVSSPMSQSGQAPRNATTVVRRWSSALLGAEVARFRRRGVPVVAFQPTVADVEVMGVNAMDPSRRAAIARQAYESTLRRLERQDTQDRLSALRGS